jgi:hypothetical protein
VSTVAQTFPSMVTTTPTLSLWPLPISYTQLSKHRSAWQHLGELIPLPSYSTEQCSKGILQYCILQYGIAEYITVKKATVQSRTVGCPSSCGGLVNLPCILCGVPLTGVAGPLHVILIGYQPYRSTLLLLSSLSRFTAP